MTDAQTASSVNSLLQEHVLPKHEVADIEAVYPGEIELLEVGRYGAFLEVGSNFLEFKLEEPDGKQDYFTVKQRFGAPLIEGELLALAWHRAARAMMAVRRTHDTYNRRRKKTKAQALAGRD